MSFLSCRARDRSAHREFEDEILAATAKYHLARNELDRATNPFEAGLGRLVKLDKEADFVSKVEKRYRLAGLVREGPHRVRRARRRSEARGPSAACG